MCGALSRKPDALVRDRRVAQTPAEFQVVFTDAEILFQMFCDKLEPFLLLALNE